MKEYGIGEIEKAVRIIIESRLGQYANLLNFTDRLEADLGADSLDLVEIVMAIEEEFNIELNDNVAETVRTFGDVINLIEKTVKVNKVQVEALTEQPYKSKAIKSLGELNGIKLGDIWADNNREYTIVFIYNGFASLCYNIADYITFCSISIDNIVRMDLIERDGKHVKSVDKWRVPTNEDAGKMLPCRVRSNKKQKWFDNDCFFAFKSYSENHNTPFVISKLSNGLCDQVNMNRYCEVLDND